MKWPAISRSTRASSSCRFVPASKWIGCRRQPAVSKRRFIDGLAEAVASQQPATYSPTKNNGTPTTARAGIAFPVNDWLSFPDGDQYLANVGSDPQLLSALAALRQKHRTAVDSLLLAIAENRVTLYLTQQFSCPN